VCFQMFGGCCVGSVVCDAVNADTTLQWTSPQDMGEGQEATSEQLCIALCKSVLAVGGGE
jgi:hypothetical protein